MIHKKGGERSAGYGLKEKKRGVCRYFNPPQASLTVLADCSCSCTPGSSLAGAHCSDSCSRTPGSSLAAACCSDSSSRTPGSSLAAALFSDSCSCTAWFVRALRRCTVLDDCSKLLTTGLVRLRA